MPYRGTYRTYKQPTILEQLLQGLSLGVTRGVDMAMRQREQKRNLMADLLTKFGTGQIPMGLAGTEVGQDIFSVLGLEKEPEIKGLIEQGRKEFEYPERTVQAPGGAAINIPGVSPQAVPTDIFLKKEQEKALLLKEAEEERKMQRQIQLHQIKGEIDAWIKERYKLSLEEQVDQLVKFMQAVEATGVPANSFSIKTDFGTVSLAGMYKRLQDMKNRQDKLQAKELDYREASKELDEIRQDTIQDILRLEKVTNPSEAVNIILSSKIQIPLKNMMLNKDTDATKMSTEEMARRLAAEANVVMKKQYDIVKQLHKESGVGEKLPILRLITPQEISKQKVKPPSDSSKPEDLRNRTKLPRVTKDEEEIKGKPQIGEEKYYSPTEDEIKKGTAKREGYYRYTGTGWIWIRK